MATRHDNEPTVQQLFDLSGRVALISGASGHLGKALSRALAEAGAAVIASSRSRERANAVAGSLPSPGGARHFGVEIDHMNQQSLAAGFDEAMACAGRIDVLVNNGNEAVGKGWSTVTPDEFSRHLENATGYFELARRVRQQAVDRGAPASIVMLGSMYGVVGSYPDAYKDVCPDSPAAYHTLKGGLVHLTRHLAVYWAKDQVRVNCLSPGPFPNAAAPAEMVNRLKTKSPMGRMGEPHELKGAIVFLASDASSYVTGQNLLVDGGWTAW
jgi:gluconate 5-dehydrogenase